MTFSVFFSFNVTETHFFLIKLAKISGNVLKLESIVKRRLIYRKLSFNLMQEYSDQMPSDIVRFPMVPIRDVVIFPITKVAFKIGRPSSVRALEEAMEADLLKNWWSENKSRLNVQADRKLRAI